MRTLSKSLLYILLSLLSLVFLIPLFYALYTSLLPLQYVDKIVSFDKFTLNNYITLFQKTEVVQWFINTVIVTVLTVLGNVVLNTMAGYALAKFNFPGKNLIFILVLASMMIPFQLIITPMYIMVAKLQLHNSLAGLILPFLYNCLYIFMARQFFMTIPKEIEEAATIDGLSKAMTFFRIIVPLSGNIIATIIILNFTTTWNSYLVPATFINEKSKYLLVVGLRTVNDQYFTRPNLVMAGVILTTLPVLLLFLRYQKYFVQGIATTGIKG